MPDILNKRFLIAALGGAAMVYLISKDNSPLYFGKEKKFLGLVDDAAGFGIDDVLKGAIIVLSGKLAANLLASKL